MDQRPPPQLPFSRNAASPFSRAPFPTSSTTSSAAASAQSPFMPTSQHPPPSNAPYSDSQRRPSDSPYYGSSRPYQPEGSSHPPSSHSRHPSASSISSATALNRTMPPPGSPPQPGQASSSHQMGPYGLPAPRAPPVSVGPPTAFPSSRELPALGSIPRAGSTGSSMSISSMLGGPPPLREPSAPSSFPPAQGAPNVSGPPFSSSLHASPRMGHAGDYPPYRRPHTPDHQRLYDARDPRAGSAGSPSGAYSTPEVQRYGTPQAYPPRGPPMGTGEPRREHSRMPSGSIPPPRPSSQPKSFSTGPPPPRPMDIGRPGPAEIYGRREELGPGAEYSPERPVRALKYEERYMTERERQERDAAEQQERDRRERVMSGGDPGRSHPMHQAEYGVQRNQPPPYGRHPDARDPRDPRDPRDMREPGPWQRQPYDQPRGPYDQPPRGSEYPSTTGPMYGSHPPAYSQPPLDRYPPGGLPPHQGSAGQPGPPPVQPYESPDRHRMGMPHPQHQQQPPPPHRRSAEDGPPPPSVAYSGSGHSSIYESPRNRPIEDLPPPLPHQRSFLGIQEINRKGRISPLPQAVQGAQPQLQGPAGEPGIKSEFGRMFSGIGMGVSGISPMTSSSQLPFTNAGLARREESDATPQETPTDTPVKTGQNGRGKRRKLKEEDSKGDDESTGRATPVGRVKRPKTQPHHHHQYVPISSSLGQPLTSSSHHHHHHHHAPDQLPSPSTVGPTPFKNVKGSTPIPSPTGLAKDLPVVHHHHAPPRSTAHANSHPAATTAKGGRPPSPVAIVIPKPNQIVLSKSVLESVASRPRNHLGDVLYEPFLKPARTQDSRTGRPPRYPYNSNPKPLPWDLIRDKENCTLTVKIGRQHLTRQSREEITSRRAVWGTEIYTDDSDVVAACIHGGWVRGEWPEDVDTDMLGLENGVGAVDLKESKADKKKAAASNSPDEAAQQPGYFTSPPKNGPVAVPEDRDMHVTLLILPRLEKYASSTRFGLMSREFGGKLGRDGARAIHDGISFMITGVRFVTNGAGAQSRLRGKARRERMRKAMMEIEGLNNSSIVLSGVKG